MPSISNISEHFCDWRSHISVGDCIQALGGDGRGWYAATIYKITENGQRLYIGYDSYSSQYDFSCSRQSKRIRPTIGFLRKKIMVPQAIKIKELEKENDKLKQEKKTLKDELDLIKNKYDTKNYKYLALKRLSSLNVDIDDSADFKINDQDEIDEDEIEDILMENVKILSEWNKITKELDALNDELNESDDDENNNLDIKDVVRIQVMMDKRIEVQQQRLDSSQNNILLPVMKQKFKIDEKIKKYQQLVQETKIINKDKLENYDGLYQDCKQLINSLNDLVLYCNQKIEKENKMNDDQIKTIKCDIFKLEQKLSQFEEYGLSYFDLLKGFQKFQILNKKYISNSNCKLKYQWKYIESNWFKWQCDDLLLWIQYKMGWLNQNIIPNYLNFDQILENMQIMGINGETLLSLKKVDLANIGFTIYSHRTTIYQLIRSLITKYKLEKDNDDNYNDNNDDDNNTCDDPQPQELQDCQSQKEGHHDSTTMDGNYDIPKKYKCSLTNELMREPVICGHNNKMFEKSAIYKYIKQNGHLPQQIQQEENGLNQINVNDVSSYLLFDDLSLKIEIEQFIQENGL